MTITIYFRDGSKVVHAHESRPGGYLNSINYLGGMAIVANAWGKETAYPLELIQKVETVPNYR